MSAPIVFFDIAGPDSNVLKAFYSEIFNWEIRPDGQFSTTIAAATVSPLFKLDVKNDTILVAFWPRVDNEHGSSPGKDV